MPGSVVVLHCHRCHTSHELHTGASLCWDHGEEWSYEQFVCVPCNRVVSVQTPHCCGGRDKTCERCGGRLTPWAGRVWHERTPEGHVGAERIEGPCPGCGEELTRVGEDGAIAVGLWD
jgi:hypothetical protein